jgi:hypothetical protein
MFRKKRSMHHTFAARLVVGRTSYMRFRRSVVTETTVSEDQFQDSVEAPDTKKVLPFLSNEELLNIRPTIQAVFVGI